MPGLRVQIGALKPLSVAAIECELPNHQALTVGYARALREVAACEKAVHRAKLPGQFKRARAALTAARAKLATLSATLARYA